MNNPTCLIFNRYRRHPDRNTFVAHHDDAPPDILLRGREANLRACRAYAKRHGCTTERRMPSGTQWVWTIPVPRPEATLLLLDNILNFRQHATPMDFTATFEALGPHLWQKFVTYDMDVMRLYRYLDRKNARLLARAISEWEWRQWGSRSGPS